MEEILKDFEYINGKYVRYIPKKEYSLILKINDTNIQVITSQTKWEDTEDGLIPYEYKDEFILTENNFLDFYKSII